MRFIMTAITITTNRDLLPSTASGAITGAVIRQAFDNMWIASVPDNAYPGEIATFALVGDQLKVSSSEVNLATLISDLNGKQATLPTVLVDITANRPVSPAVGQLYFDTTLAVDGKPIWHKGSDVWVDATGTVV
jgi:hypothetical protein